MASALLSRVTFDPAQCGGQPCIRGMRIRVADVLELLSSGASYDEILADYPYLEHEDILAAIEYAARTDAELWPYASQTDSVLISKDDDFGQVGFEYANRSTRLGSRGQLPSRVPAGRIPTGVAEDS